MSKKQFTKLKQHCEKNGVKVVLVPRRKIIGWEAMNPQAAKLMGIKKYPKNTMSIDKNAPSSTKVRDLKHEITENRLMKKGMPYAKAHVAALKAEKSKNIPRI